MPWESAKDRYEQQQPFFTLCGIIGVLREPPRKWMCVMNMKLSVLFHIIVAYFTHSKAGNISIALN